MSDGFSLGGLDIFWFCFIFNGFDIVVDDKVKFF